MSNELAKTGMAPNPLAVAAYRRDWSLKSAVDQQLTQDDIADALNQLDRWQVPMRDRDARFRKIDPTQIAAAIGASPEANQMVEAVKMIGRKVRPDFSAEQSKHWVMSIVAALSDLPPHVAMEACKAALHRPFEFPGQVEKGIRDEAVRVQDRYNVARMRLQQLRRAILSADQPALPSKPPAPHMTQDDVDRLAAAERGTLQRNLLNLAVSNGFVEQQGNRYVLLPRREDSDAG